MSSDGFNGDDGIFCIIIALLLSSTAIFSRRSCSRPSSKPLSRPHRACPVTSQPSCTKDAYRGGEEDGEDEEEEEDNTTCLPDVAERGMTVGQRVKHSREAKERAGNERKHLRKIFRYCSVTDGQRDAIIMAALTLDRDTTTILSLPHTHLYRGG